MSIVRPQCLPLSKVMPLPWSLQPCSRMTVIIGDFEDLEGYREEEDGDGDELKAPEDLNIEGAVGELITIGNFAREVNEYFYYTKDDIIEAKQMVYFPPLSLGNEH